MKSKFFLIFYIIFLNKICFAENLDISAGNISIDKKKQITVFENQVSIKDDEKNVITSNYAEYDKTKNFFTLKDNVIAIDKFGNTFKTNFATYDGNLKIFSSSGSTNFSTKQGYFVETEDVSLNNIKNEAFSNKSTVINDIQNNEIFLENFKYETNKKIFKSLGKIKVIDKSKNSYEFTQIYIDEIKKEIVGTDAKAYFNDKSFKFDKKNKPRIFSNVINIKEGESNFVKSNFTMCDYREGDKCPPWEISASNIAHDKKTKTVYYDNAVIRIYDIPIFYLPKLAHPDPTVDRRSGFLNPTFLNSRTLGSSFDIPYFWAIDKDKDLTINNRLFASEHPIFLGEYRQAFKNSNLIFDFGFTEGFKETSSKKKPGEKSHFFSKFVKSFETNNNTENNLEVNLQYVSNKKYLKLYKIDSTLVDYETEVLENSVDFNHFNDEKNLFFGLTASSFRSLKDSYVDKYEHIIPNIVVNKNLYSENFGYGNLQSNFKVHNYDTDKYKNFLINDLDWTSDNLTKNNIFENQILTKLKNINYEVKNVDKFKSDTTNELYGAIGLLTSIDLFKKDKNSDYLLKPKMLLRYSPNHMRKSTGSFNLLSRDIFSLDRLKDDTSFEGGTNLTLGFDYEKDSSIGKFNFSTGQIINEKKNNKKMPSESSLDKRFSDVTGKLSYENKKNFKINYNYAIDQNYNELNYSEIDTNFNLKNIDFNFSYLEENKITDKKKYFKSKIEIQKGENGLFTFSNKRNILTNSSEFYNLSYEYLNDCLRAGLVYRREFYNDSELEAENSLMFKITLNSLGSISAPSFNK